ncbi:MAG: HipA domain-containing protein [Amaricoccus sp.]|uniref:HipA domain-containing protein n=1 Tax=Amaricoccus sp. TaxID=1872485 RepID=UPI003315E898
MRLDVWMEAFDTPVGALERLDDKTMRFTYADDATPEMRISVAMPTTDPRQPGAGAAYGDADCVAFFGNLLFEGRELDRVIASYHLDRDDIAGILFHLGADCPGAISITPEGAGPGKRPGIFPDDYEVLHGDHLLAIVRSLHVRGQLPDAERNPSPVAGVQPKLALLVHDGQFYLPLPGSGAPTTHILKVARDNDPTIARHEAALLGLAASIGIDTAETRLVTFPDPETSTEIEAVLSTRFDRTFDGRLVRRIHSEDFCQALGLARSLKYERDAAPDAPGRFSAAAVGRLSRATMVPALFQTGFLRQTLFNLAVGNTDNHAKNATLLHAGAHPVLAPLYDVTPVTMDARYTHELAFRLGGAAFAEDVTEAGLLAAMSDLGFVRPKLDRGLIGLLRNVAGGVPMLARLGGKLLGDGVAAQLGVVEVALGRDLKVPPRDYFPRKVRDEIAHGHRGGWGTLS